MPAADFYAQRFGFEPKTLAGIARHVVEILSELLARNRTVESVVTLVLIFLTAYTVAVLRNASFNAAAIGSPDKSISIRVTPNSSTISMPKAASIPCRTTIWWAW